MAQPLPSVIRNRVWIHVAGWIFFFFIPLLLAPPFELHSALENPNTLTSMAVRNILLMGLFYFNLLYLSPTVLPQKGARTFLAIIIPIVVVISFVIWQVHHQLTDPRWMYRPIQPFPEGFPSGRRPFMMAGSLFASLLITVIVASISTSVFLWNDWLRTRGEAQQRAYEKVTSELAVLKLQISPHFLFNTLNNIRWLVRSKSDRAEEAVIKLSQILRYILYQTDAEKVPLQKEVEHLRDYISLQQMRLVDASSLVFTIVGDPTGEIAPLLMIPLVENVFKYGKFENTFLNKISLEITSGRVVFSTENRVQPASADKVDSGIGLTNLKKRLELHYPDHYKLNFGQTDDIFRARLEVILN